jgi:hypothetical protein
MKAAHIKAMGTIYSEASLTIIAAAGDDSSYGLPGVSKRARKSQQCVRTGKYVLVEVFPDLKDRLQASKWCSRAWTFQEGFLSRRRLIFDDHQVSYVCLHEYHAESITDSVRHNRTNKWRSDLSALFRVSKVAVSYKDQPYHQIMNCVERYSERSMSYQSDAFDACRGIFDSYSCNHRTHFWGVALRLRSYEENEERMLLNWYHLKPGRRRSEFPSWSWLGCEGPVHHIHGWLEVGLDLKIQFTDSNLGVISTRDYLRNERSNTLEAPRLLQLTGVCPSFRLFHGVPKFLKSPIPGVEAIYIFVDIQENLCQVYRVLPDCNALTSTDFTGCIAMVANYRFSFEYLDIFGFILKPVGSRYQRVGTFSSSFGLLEHDPAVRPLFCNKSALQLVNLDHKYRKQIFGAMSEAKDLPNAVERTIVVE